MEVGYGTGDPCNLSVFTVKKKTIMWLTKKIESNKMMSFNVRSLNA